ncbi:MAG: M15 family metallopeptidase [Chloroflexi bacterium]|nr:M15 family metallopeptidase [Chloroflexota bacterium]
MTSTTPAPSLTAPHRTPRRRRAPVVLVLVLAGIGLALAGPTGLAARVVRAVGGAPAAQAVLDGPLAPCRADDILALHREPADWARTLLDPTFRLEPDDLPSDLVPVAEAGLRGGGSVRLLVIDDLRSLAAAAREDGVTLRVRSAFRSYDDQIRTFASLEALNGRDWAELSAARAGHSEHQLGTTLDFDGGNDWLAANAWRHGFVVSYPAARSPQFTCYKAEPWHVRHVGRGVARRVHESGVSLREWLWIHADEVP